MTELYRWWRLHDEYGVDDRPVWNGRNEEVRPTIDEHARGAAGTRRDRPCRRRSVEALIPTAAGAVKVLLLARTWVSLCLWRRRGPGA